MTKKKPWPTKAVMTQIYEKHFWGGNDFDFYSGEGSHNTKFVTPYVKALTDFFNTFNYKPSVCDLGCGDFNIGKQLLPFSSKYIAVDIVEALIKRNRELFKANHLFFECIDIVTDALPKADIVILRQVLQHLSNTEIKTVLNKLQQYNYLILTEHIPNTNFTPNKDIITSRNNRLKINSGVIITKPPFNFNAKSDTILTTQQTQNPEGKITTTAYTIN